MKVLRKTWDTIEPLNLDEEEKEEIKPPKKIETSGKTQSLKV